MCLQICLPIRHQSFPKNRENQHAEIELNLKNFAVCPTSFAVCPTICPQNQTQCYFDPGMIALDCLVN